MISLFLFLVVKSFLSTVTVTTVTSKIPVIDFRPFIFGDRESKLSVVNEIRSSMKTIGFFLIKNHGIPQYLIDAGFDMENEFFRQSIAVKEQYKKALDGSHYQRNGWFKNEMLYGSRKDYKETYDILLSRCQNFNIWFGNENNKSQQLTDFYDLSMAMKTISQYMFDAFTIALFKNNTKPNNNNNNEHVLSNIHNNLNHSHMRFVYYNTQYNSYDKDDKDGLLLQPHTDFLSLTMGFQDDNGGLEIWDKIHKHWVDIPYIKGTMIVNIGDAMQRWSNDRFISNFHRVKNIQNKNSNERFAYYIFVGPDTQEIIDPSIFGVEKQDLKYQAHTFGEYFELVIFIAQ